MKRIGLHKLIERLTDGAMIEDCFTDKKRPPLRESQLPGRKIMALSEEEREVLKTAKAADFTWRGWK